MRFAIAVLLGFVSVSEAIKFRPNTILSVFRSPRTNQGHFRTDMFISVSLRRHLGQSAILSPHGQLRGKHQLRIAAFNFRRPELVRNTARPVDGKTSFHKKALFKPRKQRLADHSIFPALVTLIDTLSYIVHLISDFAIVVRLVHAACITAYFGEALRPFL